MKTIEDQGQKQVEALKDLKPRELTKEIEGKSNNKLSIQKKTMIDYKTRECMKCKNKQRY